MIRLFVLFSAALLCGGCVTKPASPVAEMAAKSKVDQDYLIRRGDILQVDVFKEPDLTTRQRVSRNGLISLPLIGSVPIAGKSATEGAALIAALLDARFVVKPYVTITILSYAPRRVTVLGQVRNPGSISIPDEERMSLPQAIATAGGPTEIGSLKRVILTRKIDGELRQTKVNAEAPTASDVEIREGDVITVTETIF